MSRIELIPLVDMSDNDLSVVANDIHSRVRHEATQSYLKSRYLIGTAVPHGESTEASLEHLKDARFDMAAGEMSAYAIKKESVVAFLGLASRMPGIILRKQATMLPPGVDRELPIIGAKPENMTKLGANVSAWVEPDVGWQTFDHENDLTQAYTALRRDSATPVWTIEPVTSRHSGLVNALYLAGYQHNEANVGHYDHQESNRDSVPVSRLFTAPVGNPQ
ncbi:MAG: hypothetical protein ABWX94_00575 [Candidatus Saccharimonadales bacterium]